MIPFERDILLDKILTEALKSRDTPREGWSQYAKDVGATEKTKYSGNFRVLDGGS